MLGTFRADAQLLKAFLGQSSDSRRSTSILLKVPTHSLLKRPLMLRLLNQSEYLFLESINASTFLDLATEVYKLFESACSHWRHSLLGQDLRGSLILPLIISCDLG